MTAPNTGPRPCSVAEALQRADMLYREQSGQYVLGTGDYRPGADDRPWTERDGLWGSDCAGFAMCWVWKLPRHRPGFASGMLPAAYRDQSDVDDDINCNSAIEDALTVQELYTVVTSGVPIPGDLLVYPTLRIKGDDGQLHTFVGHVGLVVGNDRATGSRFRTDDDANAQGANYELLDVLQCRGQNGRRPAVVKTDGSVWSHHDTVWPKPAHRTTVLRVRWAA